MNNGEDITNSNSKVMIEVTEEEDSVSMSKHTQEQ